MATVVNNPGTTSDSGSGVTFLIGMVVLLLIVIAFFYYGLPALRSAGGGAPSGADTSGGGGAGVTVPEKIDVNVNQGEGQ